MAEVHGRDPGPMVRHILDDPAASEALKRVLRDWQGRDVVDAANDAAVLQTVCQAAVLARFGRRS
ncbi:hypothetical protein [Brevundimonas sp.]